MDVAEISLSFDLEFMVGAARSHHGRPEPKQSKMRVRELLDILKDHGIHATFAICGHLFLSSCRGHPDHPLPSLLGDDPASDIDTSPGWYARPLVREIVSEGHEIACHTFSHCSFSDPACTEDVARFELEESLGLAEDLGFEMRTFVFPRHEEGHHELLKVYGFEGYVTARREWPRLASFQELEQPKLDRGLTRIPRHLYLGASANVERIPLWLIRARRGGYLHAWCHDWNLDDRSIEGIRLLCRLAPGMGFGFRPLRDLKIR
jgi:peptidoglycan/xylan/chitin deacetylase (PgdA/CDA1 family)